MSKTTRAVLRCALIFGALLSFVTAYLLTLLGAAMKGRRRRAPGPPAGERLRFIVLIPAHDEEEVIGRALQSLREVDYPDQRLEVVVIADNCRDETAELARAAGATVYVRDDPERQGKGWALRWGLQQLATRGEDPDAVVFLDADCAASHNLLAAIDARMRRGASAVQVANLVANPHESWSSALRYAAFSLITSVHPLGKQVLGLSCGILGTGFALTCDLLQRFPWETYSLSEDHDYHLRLVTAGERVIFAPEASVSSPMPISLRASTQQNLRWEGGKLALAQHWALVLVRAGLRRRDPALLHAGLELLLPPQSLLFASNAALIAAGAFSRPRWLLRLSLVNAFGQSAYVLGGLRLGGAPRRVYLALALAPVLSLWKLSLYLRLMVGRGPKGWIGARAAQEAPPRDPQDEASLRGRS